jgi:hypothetical protein
MISLNRGLIRNFNYSNLPTNNAQVTPATNGIISAQTSSPNIIEKFGANNIAIIQNMRGPNTYIDSNLGVLNVNASATLNIENLNVTSGEMTSTLGSLDTFDSTNFLTLTSS